MLFNGVTFFFSSTGRTFPWRNGSNAADHTAVEVDAGAATAGGLGGMMLAMPCGFLIGLLCVLVRYCC